MAARDLRGKVDLETDDKELEDLIIKEYEGRLTENQHRVIEDEYGNKTYWFFELSIVYLLKVLKKYKGGSYIVRRSSDNRFVVGRTEVPFFSMN